MWDVDLEFSDMPGLLLESLWDTWCRYTSTYTHTAKSSLLRLSSLPTCSQRLVRQRCTRQQSKQPGGGGLGWIRKFNMRSRFSCAYVLILRGLPGPLFLSFLGSGGHSSPRPWLESSNSRLCQKMGCSGFAVPHRSGLFHREGWSLDTVAHGVICSSHSQEPSMILWSMHSHASIKPSFTLLLYWIAVFYSLPKCFLLILHGGDIVKRRDKPSCVTVEKATHLHKKKRKHFLCRFCDYCFSIWTPVSC